MATLNWQLQSPIEAFVFDCDGTLSVLEGIDELARSNGVGDTVEALTSHAMTNVGMSPEFYQKRLELVKPRFEQVVALGREYYKQQVPHVSDVIKTLLRLGKTVYIVSAGLQQSVEFFGGLLDVPRKNIFAVNIHFDENGKYVNFDQASPLVKRDGKQTFINELKKRHSRIAHIGDGLNDHVVYDLVTRFIGFGGVFYRENIAANCEFYIKSTSMSPLLPLGLTHQEFDLLTIEEKELYHQGLGAIHEQEVVFNSPAEFKKELLVSFA